MRGHHLTVGTGAADGDKVSPAALGQCPILAESVGGLADRPNHIIDVNIPGIPVLIVCGKVLDRVIGAIEGWTDKIIHPSVHHQEIPALPFLDENNLGDKRSALSHNGASRLNVDGLVKPAGKFLVYGSEPGLEISHRIRIGVVIIDPKAAA